MSGLGSQIFFILKCLGATLCISALYSLCAAVTRRKDLPPGPKGAPFFGNGLQLPKLDQHLKMTEWARQYVRYIPAWMPGMDFKRSAAIARKAIRDMEEIPYRNVMQEMANGIVKPSMATRLIDRCLKDGVLNAQDQRDIEGTVGSLYAAGTDTTMAPLLVFMLMMSRHPDMLEKIQDEITRVVGQSRLPDFEDRASLPYLECVLREAYRWCPVAPIIPHQSMEDDVYRGYYIPNKAVILLNAWAMSRDPEVYPEPDVFKPERFLSQNGAVSDLHDPRKFVFGFGRRICPGRYFADATIWLAVASIAATMDMRQAVDSQGETITQISRFVSGIVMELEPFLCDIRPRSEKSLQLISGMGNTTEY
ncbi:hypothetical protein FOMPIDRAFT_1045040 [Fomitopsis schrenkii]|uniref:Cytochrome P450 n=1 Tax=Fomitopsis schrenkii TaxID=2126942 RepID=S8EKX1_FOMSC|nr:hypothetical protein FOMPIDRAFT_1045040 [Fomitopsis schrenkii]